MHFDGFADHLVSESMYLHSPKHNSIEIYSDKPRNNWQHDGKGYVIIIDTLPLDLESILPELSKDQNKNTIPQWS